MCEQLFSLTVEIINSFLLRKPFKSSNDQNRGCFPWTGSCHALVGDLFDAAQTGVQHLKGHKIVCIILFFFIVLAPTNSTLQTLTAFLSGTIIKKHFLVQNNTMLFFFFPVACCRKVGFYFFFSKVFVDSFCFIFKLLKNLTEARYWNKSGVKGASGHQCFLSIQTSVLPALGNRNVILF